MWLQYDHLLPHSRGGNNDLENLVITCAPCNFARMQFTLTEVGIENPFLNKRAISNWDGLERILKLPTIYWTLNTDYYQPIHSLKSLTRSLATITSSSL